MTIRIGLVGLGMMGAAHLKAWQTIEGAQVVAVCDVRPERLEGDLSQTLGNIDTGAAGRKDFSGIEKHKGLAGLLRSDIDAVDLCVPTFLHARMAVQCLKAGRHVFCEKPMALNVRQAIKMIQASEQARRTLMIGHCLRFWPEYVMMKEMIDSGRYGPVRSAAFRRFAALPTWADWFLDAKRSGGAALDLHVHDTDTVQWFFGMPNRVCSQGVPGPGGGFDHIATLYQYDRVPVVLAEGGWHLPAGYPFWMGAAIEFESAAVVYNSRHTPTLTVYEPDGKAVNPPIAKVSAYAEQLRYFAECISSASPPRRAMAEDAARTVALVEAEMRSARTHRPVPVKF